MPQAALSPTTRRSLVAGALAFTASGNVQGTPAALDAQLVALGERLRVAGAIECALSDDEYDGHPVIAECSRLVREIEATSARTLDGLRVKASAILWCHSGAFDEDSLLHANREPATDMRLVLSILRDLTELPA